jgi:hypothetical protein
MAEGEEEMTERPILFSTPMVKAILDGRKTMTRRVVKVNSSGRVQFKHKQWHIEDENSILGCPYGITGDHLWVRETFVDTYDLGDYPGHPIYKATYLKDLSGFNPPPETWDIAWKPSIFMPRCASRITLEITNVRVERLHEITEEDAEKEGVSFTQYTNANARFHFMELWDSINGNKYPWNSNPWVWVIEFRKVK